ncbi:unnamed protein product [Citrullus colocynthis]|uniref:Uncharacterized protein n=1 Tax=Citrullus colocynthis TaxID=252529 RepID=A0ABP0YWW5_9ROSI
MYNFVFHSKTHLLKEALSLSLLIAISSAVPPISTASETAEIVLTKLPPTKISGNFTSLFLSLFCHLAFLFTRFASLDFSAGFATLLISATAASVSSARFSFFTSTLSYEKIGDFVFDSILLCYIICT